MNMYAAVLAIPGKAGKKIGALRERYARFMDYCIVPHLTLAYPFTTSIDLSLIYHQLDKAAQGASSFTLRLSGVRYFEGHNNVAYVAVADRQPIFALNRTIAHALKGLVIAKQPLLFDPKEFVPHVTIAEYIPHEMLAAVKSDLSAVQINCAIKVRSFSLFTAKDDEKPQIWRRASVHPFGGTA